MRIRATTSLLAAAGLANAASGQYITTSAITANLDMTWQEDPVFPHNDNGLLEPGEHALILTTLSFAGQFTRVDIAPTIGAFIDGIVVGLGYANVDIRSASADPTGLYNNGVTIPPSSSVGPDANSGGTAGYGVRSVFRVAGYSSNGMPLLNGFRDIQPGQFYVSPSAPTVQYADPITNLDRLGWAPSSYAPRTVNFAVGGAAGAGASVVGLYLDFDGLTNGTQAGYVPGNTGGVAYIPLNRVTFGSVNIPIAPAPAGFALLGMAGLIAGRRRVRAPSEGSP